MTKHPEDHSSGLAKIPHPRMPPRYRRTFGTPSQRGMKNSFKAPEKSPEARSSRYKYNTILSRYFKIPFFSPYLDSRIIYYGNEACGRLEHPLFARVTRHVARRSGIEDGVPKGLYWCRRERGEEYYPLESMPIGFVTSSPSECAPFRCGVPVGANFKIMSSAIYKYRQRAVHKHRRSCLKRP